MFRLLVGVVLFSKVFFTGNGQAWRSSVWRSNELAHHRTLRITSIFFGDFCWVLRSGRGCLVLFCSQRRCAELVLAAI
uniref:Secreted protein n=1 Tax=Anguilla anguilla TaxID=7936 RepID=A0A0E9PLG2_ANGAN